MTEPQSDRQGGDGLPTEHEKVLGFVADASVAIHDEPMVVWRDSEGEWWGGLPQSFIKLSDHNWTVDRWEPLPTRDAAEGADPLVGLDERLDRLCLGAKDGSRFILSTESAQNIVGIVREWIRAKAASPETAPDAMREALEHVTELLVDSWSEVGDGDPENQIAILNSRALLSAPVPPADGALEQLAQHFETGKFGKDKYLFPNEIASEIREFLPSPAVAAEPDPSLGLPKSRFAKYKTNAELDAENATPPVRGDREILREQCATIFREYLANALGETRMLLQDICHDIDDALSTTPVQPGAGEREAIQRARHYIANRFTNDSQDAGKQIVAELDAILSIHRTTVPASTPVRSS